MALVILALVRAAVSFVSRYFLYRVAFEIEYDLRTIVYEHLTRLSFSFYDRVQSGQLISRANSDIRSVQMYLTFAPSILVQCLSAVFAYVEDMPPSVFAESIPWSWVTFPEYLDALRALPCTVNVAALVSRSLKKAWNERRRTSWVMTPMSCVWRNDSWTTWPGNCKMRCRMLKDRARPTGHPGQTRASDQPAKEVLPKRPTHNPRTPRPVDKLAVRKQTVPLTVPLLCSAWWRGLQSEHMPQVQRRRT